MALDSLVPDQNGEQHGPPMEADPAEQTAIEEASVIHLLRVLVAEAAPNVPKPKAPPEEDDSAMEHDAGPQAADPQQEEINDVTCEEAGCLLWDMSASRPVARVMLRNRALEALEVVIARELQLVQTANRPDPDVPGPAAAAAADNDGCASPEGAARAPAAAPEEQQRQQQRRRHANALRILEICLGTLANLIVTQPAAAAAVSDRPELIAALLLPPRTPDDDDDDDDDGGVDPEAAEANAAASSRAGGALYVDDARVLSELFRFFSLALRCQGAATWLTALSSPAVLQRVMWVGAATADAQLFTRFLDMLVALLHAASGAEEAEEAGEGGPGGSRGHDSGGEGAAAPGAAAAAACGAALGGDEGAAAGVAERAAAGAACCRVLLECGLLGLIHQVLLQALRGCMPAEEKYGELGGGGGDGGDVYASAADSDARAGGASPPSVASGAEVSGKRAGTSGASAGSTGPRGEAVVAGTTAKGTPSPRADGSCRNAAPPVAAVRPGLEGVSCGVGDGVSGSVSPGDDAAAAATGTAAAAAAAAATAAAAAGPVPLSDEAVDAALRLIEELVSPSGPLAASGGSEVRPEPGDAAAGAGGGGSGGGGPSGAAVLLQLYADRGLRPGLMQLLLGLLRYQYDSMQVVEGLLVVLVDLGPAVQEAVAASPSEQVAAVAARLVELLQDSCYSPADGAPSSIVQLQQGAWYLLAATLRGALVAAAAAGAAAVPGGVAPAAAAPASWLAHWPALEQSLAVVPELPRPEGCEGYVRACGVAGLVLLEQAWMLQQRYPRGVAAGPAGALGVGEGRGGAQAAGGGAARENGLPAGGGGGPDGEESLARLGAALQELVGSMGGRGPAPGAE